MKLLPPRTVLQKRYVIIRKIGEGGMGAVYEAKDQRLRSLVALKQTLMAGDAFGQAFEREAQILARLNHHSLPKVSDYFFEYDSHFLVMQYIEGSDLGQLLRRRGSSFALEQVLAWADQLLEVLEYLHSRNPPVIHRDIKPSNIKLTPDGRVVLLDFGLSKGGSTYWRTMGGGRSVQAFTPHYASLEQINGKGTDQRSDLYSVGATLYRLLTNSKLPNASTRAQSLLTQQVDPLLPANQVNSHIPSAVADVLQRTMSLNPQQRPQSAAQLRRALHSAVSMPDIKSPWEQISKPHLAAMPAIPSPSRPRVQSQPVISKPSSSSGSYSGPNDGPNDGARRQRQRATALAGFTWQQWAIASLTGVLLLLGIALLLINPDSPQGSAAATSEPNVVINTQVSASELSRTEIPTDPISPEATVRLLSGGGEADNDNQNSASADVATPEPTSTLLVGVSHNNRPNNTSQNNQNNSPTEVSTQNNNNIPATQQPQQEAPQATQQAQQAPQATQQAQQALQATEQAQQALQATQQAQQALQATQQAQQAQQATQQAQEASAQATQQANAVATAQAAGNAEAQANAEATQNAMNVEATAKAELANATLTADAGQAYAMQTADAELAYAQATADAELAYAQATVNAELAIATQTADAKLAYAQATVNAELAIATQTADAKLAYAQATSAAAQATEDARQLATLYAIETQQARQAASQATEQAASAQATRRAQQTQQAASAQATQQARRVQATRRAQQTQQAASAQATQQARRVQATASALAQVNLVPISLIAPPSKSSYFADETINFQWSWQGSLADGRAPRYRIYVLKFGNFELFLDSDEASFLWYHKLNPEEYTWYVIVLDENGQEIPETRSGENSFWIVTR